MPAFCPPATFLPVRQHRSTAQQLQKRKQKYPSRFAAAISLLRLTAPPQPTAPGPGQRARIPPAFSEPGGQSRSREAAAAAASPQNRPPRYPTTSPHLPLSSVTDKTPPALKCRLTSPFAGYRRVQPLSGPDEGNTYRASQVPPGATVKTTLNAGGGGGKKINLPSTLRGKEEGERPPHGVELFIRKYRRLERRCEGGRRETPVCEEHVSGIARINAGGDR